MAIYLFQFYISQCKSLVFLAPVLKASTAAPKIWGSQ